MKNLFKIFIGLTVIILIGLFSLSIFLHFYLTGPRLKALIIPKAEQALQRRVKIGSITVGLFKGIEIKDFQVKTLNQRNNFATFKKFLLRFKLLPLLHGNVDITSVEIDSPSIHIYRNQNGTFNFQEMGHAANKRQSTNIKEFNRQKALPFLLAINTIDIKNADIQFTDRQKKLPSCNIQANALISLNYFKITQNGINYKGTFHLNALSKIKNIVVKSLIDGSIDNTDITSKAKIDIQNQIINIFTSINNYMANADITLNINSKKINLNTISMAIAGLTKTTQSKKTAQNNKSLKTNKITIPNIKIHGDINIDNLIYKKAELNNLTAKYSINNGTVRISKLSGIIADGRLTGNAYLDTNRHPLLYKTNIKIAGLDIGTLMSQLKYQKANLIKGYLNLELGLNGRGTRQKDIQKYLTGKGIYSVKDLTIRHTQLTMALAKLLGVTELSNLKFKEGRGNIHIKNGKIQLNGQWTGKQLSLMFKGNVGIDRHLNVPVTLYLSKSLTQKITKSSIIGKYFKKDKTQIDLLLKGNLSSPHIILSPTSLKKEIKNNINRLIFKFLNR